MVRPEAPARKSVRGTANAVVVPLFRVWGGEGNRNGDGATELPDVTGMSNAEAAEAYAKAGICVLPIKPGTKNPGSYLGRGWPGRASFDLDTVREWWRRWPDAGIAIHVGGSRLLVIDVDIPENVPALLWPLLERAVFRRTTSDPESRRGHYFYRLRPGEMFGNGLGGLKLPKGEKWGEVKCYGGGLVLAPTVHPRADEGGQYSTGPTETIPYRPDEIADKLNAAPDADERQVLTPGELDAKAAAFLNTYTDDREPYALDPICRDFDATPSNRHPSLWNALCWAMREAKAGRYPAQRAADALRKLWTEAIGGEYRDDDPDEFNRLLRDAIAVADADGTVEELRARAGGFADVKNLSRAEAAMAPGGPWHSDTFWPDNKTDVQPATDDDERTRRITNLANKLEEQDEARRLVAERKARALINVNSDRFMDGWAFVNQVAQAGALWGDDDGHVLMAPGEGLMIVGPQGVGKSTVGQQLVLARMGLRGDELFGYSVETDDRPILYLAMDRPRQIARSMLRMINPSTDRESLRERLIFWDGRPPIMANEAPEAFAEWVAKHGRGPGMLIVDSVKDVCSGLTKDEDGIGFNAAMQLVISNRTEVVSLHHQRKANADNRKPDKLSDVYGSGWLTAGQGSVLLLWGEPGARSVELSHLKQPQERIPPFIINHEHASGKSAATDPMERLREIARNAGDLGITEAEAVRAVFDIGQLDDGYDNAKKSVRRKLDRMVADKRLIHEPGSRGGSGGGGKPARWTLKTDESG